MRSIKPVEVNQYDITMANDIARDAHCETTMGSVVAWEIHCDVTMSNDVAMCTYQCITMHKFIAMNILYYVFYVIWLIIILLWVVCNKNKNKFILGQSGLENTFVVFV